MEQFPHLKFIQKITGTPKLHGNGETNPQTLANKQNREGHSRFLKRSTNTLKTNWLGTIQERAELNLPPLDSDTIPVFLQINPDILTSDFDLEKFGIEIISEENNGFIIGASFDGLQSLEQKINDFITSEHGSGKIADLWEIVDGNNELWKPEHILSEELWEKWNDIDDDTNYQLEIGVAFAKPMGKEPDPTKQGGQTRLNKYRQKQEERDDLLMEREGSFRDFINYYGEIKSSLINLDDSFSCEVEINGKGLKDLVHNYPFVFEVTEVEGVSGVIGTDLDEGIADIEILPPEEHHPEIGMIDSGVMEEHRFLAAAIKSENSVSYVKDDTSTADHVTGGGHGTKVAGAMLYPKGISNVEGTYQLPFFVRNLRILDRNNRLLEQFPAELMKQIVEENGDCKVFNLSVNSNSPFRKKHMSAWAATIDSLSHENNILFIISAGNISQGQIKHYINSGEVYPDFLLNPNCRLANPAQSSFGLVVGSINHAAFEDDNWQSLGNENDVSAFSRIGEGIWGKIKPDVVEYGGGLIASKSSVKTVTENSTTSPELIRSTLHGGSAYGKDTVGTSFAAPKVAHIVAQLLKLYPDEDVNLIRALVAQGARLPNGLNINPTVQSIKYYGYGIPSLERVTKNTEQRITFYNTGKVSANEGHIYSLKIPESIRNQGDEYDILIEVSLAYTSKVRRTRQKTKSYLSTWLDWVSSKLNEDYNSFSQRAIKELGATTDEENEATEVIQWKIRERGNWGDVTGLNRNNSTLQKDWAIIKSFELPEELSFSIRGHKGWNKNNEEIPYSFVVSIEAINSNLEIYEQIRIENEVETPVTT